jgi:threonine aldolase
MRIDLRSDTVTTPSTAMRQAMAGAEVGDDVLDGDPTVRRLEGRVAELLGTEDALFFPSGSMANQAAIALHAPPGTEVLLDAGAHILDWEMAAAGTLSGVQLRAVESGGSCMDPGDLRRAIRQASRFAPRLALMCVENTHNGAGGRVASAATMRAFAEVASEAGVPLHLDGARLWNAAAASGESLRELANGAATVMVSFSKGLGAPVGAALGCRAEDRERLWVIRKRFGGGMRQAGIIAAGALYAIDNNLERLADDHRHARLLADSVSGVGGASVVAPESNIVMIDLPPGVRSTDVVQAVAAHGVLISPWTASRVRAVTHLDITTGDIERAAMAIGECFRLPSPG